jgi:hypothetical protein
VSFAQSASKISIRGDLRKYLVACVANRARNRKRDESRHETIGLDGAESLACESRRPEQWAIIDEELRRLSGYLATSVVNRVRDRMRRRQSGPFRSARRSHLHHGL